MGQRKYPPLLGREVREILVALGFVKKSPTGSSHEQWERAASSGHRRAVVTVDQNESPFNEYITKMMINQSTFTREEFYGSTEGTAKKIGVKHLRNAQRSVDEKNLNQ